MVLSEWIEKQPRGAISRLARATGMAYTTVFYAAHGGAICTLETARKLSEATGGEVTLEELVRQSKGPRKALARARRGGRQSRSSSQ